MTLGLLVALENVDTHTDTQTRFMFYKYRLGGQIRPLVLAKVEFARNICAGIGPLQLGVVLIC